MSRTPRVPKGTTTSAGLAAAMNEWQAVVVLLDGIDPVTTELTRLLSARRHDCLT